MLFLYQIPICADIANQKIDNVTTQTAKCRPLT